MRARGFTLIEVVVTVAIVAILTSVAVPLTQLAAQRSKEQELRSALRQLREAIDAYKQASDDGKIAKTVDQSGYPPSLEVLVEGVADARDPKKRKLYFLRRIPRDPMYAGMESNAGSWGQRSYASSAEDPRVGADVYDVYSQSGGNGLNGVPYREW